MGWRHTCAVRVMPTVFWAQCRNLADPGPGPQDGPKDCMVRLGCGVWLGADFVIVGDREDPSGLRFDYLLGQVNGFRGREVALL